MSYYLGRALMKQGKFEEAIEPRPAELDSINDRFAANFDKYLAGYDERKCPADADQLK